MCVAPPCSNGGAVVLCVPPQVACMARTPQLVMCAHVPRVVPAGAWEAAHGSERHAVCVERCRAVMVWLIVRGGLVVRGVGLRA